MIITTTTVWVSGFFCEIVRYSIVCVCVCVKDSARQKKVSLILVIPQYVLVLTYGYIPYILYVVYHLVHCSHVTRERWRGSAGVPRIEGIVHEFMIHVRSYRSFPPGSAPDPRRQFQHPSNILPSLFLPSSLQHPHIVAVG